VSEAGAVHPLPASRVRDPSLAPSGRERIEWARRHMPVLAAAARGIAARGRLRGLRVGMCLHLEAKTACLALALQEAGARVAITGSNPLSTQDPVAAALAAEGVTVFAWHGATAEEYREFLRSVLDFRPDLLLDDGADLIALYHAEGRQGVRGATEETTTGVHRLRAMEREGVLRLPVVAVNDARMKYLFDNRHGTGQSAWDGVMRATNLLVAGKSVAVIGYGWCGRGIARRAQGLGARVTVCEVDPVAANEAILDGCRVAPALEAAGECDIFITATGCRGVLGREHFLRMKDGAILANAGHFDVEVDVAALARLAAERRRVREHVEEFRLPDGRRLYLLAEGRLVNLAAGDGHPVEIMDISFALQALSLEYAADPAAWGGAAAGGPAPRVVPVPAAVDQEVARLRLAAAGAAIDALTPEQLAYLSSWRLGTHGDAGAEPGGTAG
jgi:adenosylhomocysteinase